MVNLRIVRFAALLAVCGPLSAQEGKQGTKPVASEANVAKADAAPARVGVPAAALVIGVVDFAKVLELYPRAIAERERLSALRKTFNEQMDGLTKRIEELKLQLPLYPEGSRELAMKQLDLETLMQQRPALAKLLNEQLQIEEMRMEVALYEDVETAIGKVAADRGVHLVMRMLTDLPERKEDAGPKEIQARVMAYDRRQVWFAAPEVDLTPHVIKFLQVPLEKPKAAADKSSGKTPEPGKGKGQDGVPQQGSGGL